MLTRLRLPRLQPARQRASGGFRIATIINQPVASRRHEFTIIHVQLCNIFKVSEAVATNVIYHCRDAQRRKLARS